MNSIKMDQAKSIVNLFTPFQQLPPQTQLSFEDLVTGRLNKNNVNQIKYLRKKKGLMTESWKYGLACSLYDLYLDVLKEEQNED